MMSVLDSELLRRYIPWGIAAVLIVLTMADTVVIEPTINSLASSALSASTVIGAFVVVISVVMITRIHVRRVSRQRTVIESSVLLICMWGTLIWGLFRLFVSGVSPTSEPTVLRIFDAIVSPGDSTVFAILAFFIASAAYRAFRARNLDSTILLMVAILSMLAKAPIGESIFGPGIVVLGDFVLGIANKAGRRVFLMAMILASIALTIRIILGYERGWMGRATE
jgi:hypothetical protein